MKINGRFARGAVMATVTVATVTVAAVTVAAVVIWFVFFLLESTPPAVQLIANPGNRQVTLRWAFGVTDYDENNITGWEYQQYQRERDGAVGLGWRKIPAAAAAKRHHLIDNLTNGWTYIFRVRAVNENGPGTPSNEATATPDGTSDVLVDLSKVRLPAIQAHLGRIEEHLVDLRVREMPNLSGLKTELTGIAGRLDRVGEGLSALAANLDRSSTTRVTEPATLLPVHLLVHFENAQLSGASGELGDEGIVLEPVHQTMLHGTVNALAECTAQGSPVTIKPYGFASSAPFVGRSDTDDLNVQVANGRADAVHDELMRLSAERPNLSIKAPTKWSTFEDMVMARNACIESPSGTRARGAFLDRVVVLDLQTMGRCAGTIAGAIRCSTPGGGR